MKATVIIPTWRLGGLDCTLGSLAKQTSMDFEVVLVDDLHRWRAPEIAERLAALPFKVKHVPVCDSLGLLTTHGRHRNTGIRYAEGSRLVFLADYACPPPTFIEEHAKLEASALGLNPYRLHHPDPDTVIYSRPPDDVWNVYELAIACRLGDGNSKILWSVFNVGDPLAAALAYEQRTGFNPVYHPFPPTPAPLPNHNNAEVLFAWKCDSAPTELVRAINGWDLDYDGQGPHMDTEFALRLLWAGATVQLVNLECPIIDAHGISRGKLIDQTRDNLARLEQLRAAGEDVADAERRDALQVGIEP